MADQPEKSMDQVIREDGRYPLEAFEFLHDGLTKAVKDNHAKESDEQEPDTEPTQNHVSGAQMCMAIHDLAIERWGMLARTVLERWNIHATIDFGNMVYLLIRNNFMRKTEDDSLDDFRNVYDFTEAFDNLDNFNLTE